MYGVPVVLLLLRDPGLCQEKRVSKNPVQNDFLLQPQILRSRTRWSTGSRFKIILHNDQVISKQSHKPQNSHVAPSVYSTRQNEPENILTWGVVNRYRSQICISFTNSKTSTQGLHNKNNNNKNNNKIDKDGNDNIKCNNQPIVH